MHQISYGPLVQVTFDESHSESWSVSLELAREMQPENPYNSSYEKASTHLRGCGFAVNRFRGEVPLDKMLEKTDVFIIVHPCDPKWERTTSFGTARFSEEDIENIRNSTKKGGGLIIITEYEHQKYGSNLDALLKETGIAINNTTANNQYDCHNGNRTWVYIDPLDTKCHPELLSGVRKACFYRSATCTVTESARAVCRTSSLTAQSECLAAASNLLDGRIIVFCDSDIFGDEYFEEFDHKRLWENTVLWTASNAMGKHLLQRDKRLLGLGDEAVSAWDQIKSCVTQLQELQNADGSVSLKNAQQTNVLVKLLISRTEALSCFFSHQRDYFQTLVEDFNQWEQGGYGKPDFRKSLESWHPESARLDGTLNIAIFPMYLPNARDEVFFEAVLFQVPWPEWLATIESDHFHNPAFVPGILIDYTPGYDSNCAVLFPENVSVKENASNHFGIIFCDRESERFIKYTKLVADFLKFTLPPDFSNLLRSNKLATDAYLLWDLIHDKHHTKGFLPFDPFIIRQRMCRIGCTRWRNLESMQEPILTLARMNYHFL